MSDAIDETKALKNGVNERVAIGQASQLPTQDISDANKEIIESTEKVTQTTTMSPSRMSEEDFRPSVFIRCGGDVVDARSVFDVFRQRSTAATGQLSTTVENFTYNMKHKKRGKCLIFNHRIFDGHTRLNERRGTEVDARDLAATFRSLDFEVFRYDDLSARDLHTILNTENHSQNDCIVVCILTHGEHGTLWARDDKYNSEMVYEYFKGEKCPTLASKPKIFFVQACQGDKLDSGVVLSGPIDVCDAGPAVFRIPNYADFLIAYSTVPGYYSWRNTSQGSWFIQSLNKVFSLEASRMDLVTMLTLVSRYVAYDYESNVPNDPEFHQKKQIPCINSMLTRLVFFNPKP